MTKETNIQLFTDAGELRTTTDERMEYLSTLVFDYVVEAIREALYEAASNANYNTKVEFCQVMRIKGEEIVTSRYHKDLEKIATVLKTQGYQVVFEIIENGEENYYSYTIDWNKALYPPKIIREG
ncbi:MAG: hypothetical protein GF334_04190 [Candidatus Altiarchaeales archaeon]|nr:hypothetical protein [Candidatus Altiarchaeales archaeon]